MLNNRFYRMVGSLLVVALSTGWLIASPRSPHTTGASVQIDTPSSTKVSTLLGELQSRAVTASLAASSLASASRGPAIHWESQANYLMQVREQINAMNEAVSKLQALGDEALPWQQQAVQRTTPILADLARNTQSAIDFLNANQERLFSPDYRAELTSIDSRATQLSDTLDAFRQLDKTNQRLADLQATLRAPVQ
jgi:hypothetical protein